MRAALAWGVIALACWLPGDRQQASRPLPDVEAAVARLNAAADEYKRIFRGLTAQEIKVIEIVDERGRVEKRREVVSDLLVYQSARGREVTEYRDVLSVDGKPLARRGARALELLTRAARKGTIHEELEAIDRETMRYEFRRHLRGFAIGQFQFPSDWQRTYEVALEGRDTVDGHEVAVLAYRELVSPRRTSRPLPLPREFGDPPRLWRGRVWFDAATGQVRRMVREMTARHPAAEDPLVMIRAEAHYARSRFSILVPDRLVFEWRQRFSHPKGAPPALLLEERTTFTYGEFRRFEVATSETIGAVP